MQNGLNKYIGDYIAELNRKYKGGNATEHTYRPALQRLLENITQRVALTNKPKQIACGAPDYILTRYIFPLYLYPKSDRLFAYEDIQHYQKMIKVLWETSEIQKELNAPKLSVSFCTEPD